MFTQNKQWYRRYIGAHRSLLLVVLVSITSFTIPLTAHADTDEASASSLHPAKQTALEAQAIRQSGATTPAEKREVRRGVKLAVAAAGALTVGAAAFTAAADPHSRQQIIRSAVQAAEATEAAQQRQAKYYVKMMQKIGTEGTELLATEKERLSFWQQKRKDCIH